MRDDFLALREQLCSGRITAKMGECVFHNGYEPFWSLRRQSGG